MEYVKIKTITIIKVCLNKCDIIKLMHTLISKILNYEDEIFNEYISKRKKLIKNIKEQTFLNKKQSLNFVNDLKAIIDPIKTSISSIDYYFTNLNFDKNNTETDISKILCTYLLLETYLTSSLDTLDTLEPELPPESVSGSVSDSDVSSK